MHDVCMYWQLHLLKEVRHVSPLNLTPLQVFDQPSVALSYSLGSITHCIHLSVTIYNSYYVCTSTSSIQIAQMS